MKFVKNEKIDKNLIVYKKTAVSFLNKIFFGVRFELSRNRYSIAMKK